MRALYVIDMNKAFGKGSPLAVDGAEEIIEGVNRLMAEGYQGDPFDVILASYEEHQKANRYLASTYKVEPNTRVTVNGIEVYCWVEHAMTGTSEVEPLDGVRIELFNAIFRKGWDHYEHPYSSMMALLMYGSIETKMTAIEYLKKRGITELVIVGLAYDFCVGETALEAVKHFKVTVIKSLTGSVFPETECAMDDKLEKAGVTVVWLEERK